MIISEILKDKRHLMKLKFCDGTEIFLDKDICADNALSKGMDLEQAQIAKLRYDSEYVRAKSRALWYLDRSDHTEKALFDKLVRAGFDKKASAAVLARFAELGLVDDRRFAENFAERCSECNISERETLHKMLQKGVPYDMAREVLNELDTDEISQIKSLVEKKYSYKLTLPDGAQKVFAALARKGFSYSSIRQVLNEYISEMCEEY